jgi:hypothetical protein
MRESFGAYMMCHVCESGLMNVDFRQQFVGRHAVS